MSGPVMMNFTALHRLNSRRQFRGRASFPGSWNILYYKSKSYKFSIEWKSEIFFVEWKSVTACLALLSVTFAGLQWLVIIWRQSLFSQTETLPHFLVLHRMSSSKLQRITLIALLLSTLSNLRRQHLLWWRKLPLKFRIISLQLHCEGYKI